MNRRECMFHIVTIAAIPVLGLTAGSNSELFITMEEYAREQKKRAAMGNNAVELLNLRARGDVGAPEIIVKSPSLDSPIKGPVNIDVEFVPGGDAPIDLSSFKVTYGFLGIDVTDRVKRYATITTNGVKADLPAMPKGQHNFELQISDTFKRMARKRMRCEVVS
jgi:hypothetical protein